MPTKDEVREVERGFDAVFDEVPRWEAVPWGEQVGRCPHKLSGVVEEVTCDAPAIRRRQCSSCKGYHYACEVHAVDDMTDIDIARFKKQLLPQILQYAHQASDVERAVRAAEAQRRQAIDELTNGIHLTLLRFVGAERIEKAINKAFQLTPDTISIVMDGKSHLDLPRSFIPGETPLDMVKHLCRIAVEMLAGAADGVSYGVERIREEQRPTVLVQCDDFGPVEDEHHSLVARVVQVGTTAELAALNEALRLCARPARAFRAGDHVEAYASDEHHHHDHGAS